MPQDKKSIIQKWYNKLCFPKKFDSEFFSILNSVVLPDEINVQTYDVNYPNGERNFLAVLYMCEQAQNLALKKHIPQEIIDDTLADIVTWTNTWSSINGSLFLKELSWLFRHLNGKLYRLGRLQFEMSQAHVDVPEFGVIKGENVIDVHIPEGGKLSPTECDISLDNARKFFDKYFPEYKYKVFTCHSWLLDKTLTKYLPQSSNILHFSNRFKKVEEDNSYDVLKYVFNWNITPETLPNAIAPSTFAEKIKIAFLQGEQFHTTLGLIKK